MSRAARRSRSLIALAILLAPIACAPEPDPRPNVLLLVGNGLRAAHLGARGNLREPSSPHLDALARSSLRFVRAYAASAQARASLAAILTGHASASPGVPANEVSTLAESLHNAGYTTGAASGQLDLLERSGLLQGFDLRRDPQPANRTAGAIDPPFGAALELLDELAAGRAPWLLFVHQGQLGQLDQLDQLDHRGAVEARERYAARLHAADAGLGELVARLAALGVADRTLIAVTADHGVALDPRGPAIGQSLHEEMIRVPLLLRPPRGVEPRAIQPPVSLLSLAPTLLELAGVAVAAERFAAPTLSEWLFGDPARPAANAVFSELGAQRAVIEARYKLILDGASGEARLYDLAADPGEKHDLARQQPALRGRLERLLSARPEAAATDLSPR